MSELNPANQSERLSVQEAAEMLGTGQEAVRKAMREGRLPHDKDLHGRNVRYSTTREAVEEYKNNRGSRVVAGYSDEAIAQSKEMLGRYFGNLQNAIEESTELERQRLEVDRERLEIDRQMTEEIQGLREEVRQRMSIDKELLEEQKKSREAIEVIQGFKEEGGEEQKPEQRSWWKFWGG